MNQDSKKIIGKGWRFPLRVTETLSAEMVDEAEDIRQSIEIILGTSRGERVMRPDFGTALDEILFEPISQATGELLRVRVEEALQKWEHRIDVLSVQVSQGAGLKLGLLSVHIDYRIRSTNTEENLVYPFYHEEIFR